MRKILLSISMILICSVGFSADSINAQGVLRDADGVPVSSGSYAMRFLLYPAAEDGALLWAEVHTGSDKVTVSRGLYTAELGALTPFPDEFFSANPDLWLEVGVDLDDNAIFESNEILPRLMRSMPIIPLPSRDIRRQIFPRQIILISVRCGPAT